MSQLIGNRWVVVPACARGAVGQDIFFSLLACHTATATWTLTVFQIANTHHHDLKFQFWFWDRFTLLRIRELKCILKIPSKKCSNSIEIFFGVITQSLGARHSSQYQGTRRSGSLSAPWRFSRIQWHRALLRTIPYPPGWSESTRFRPTLIPKNSE